MNSACITSRSQCTSEDMICDLSQKRNMLIAKTQMIFFHLSLKQKSVIINRAMMDVLAVILHASGE